MVIAKADSPDYYEKFIATAKILKAVMLEKENKYWSSKMLLKAATFNEKTFVQYAIETAVVKYLPKGITTISKSKQRLGLDIQIRTLELIYYFLLLFLKQKTLTSPLLPLIQMVYFKDIYRNILSNISGMPRFENMIATSAT